MTRCARILGAGPAGLTAALTLARAGFSVDVYERRRDVGLRFPGDLQGLENWSRDEDALDELARCGIDDAFDRTAGSRIEMIGGREHFHVSTSRPSWYIVRRGSAPGTLDHSLRVQAESAGVRLHFDCVDPPPDMDIIATGPRPGQVVGVGKGLVFDTSAPDTSVLVLDRSLARTGYAYLLITQGHGVMACGIYDAFTRIDACFEATRERLAQLRAFDITNARPFGGVEAFCSRPRWREGRALLVGEAAGLQDLLWGFGIRTAVRSGWLAARALIEGSDYAVSAQQLLAPGLRAGVVGRALWELGSVCNFEWTVRLLRSMPDPVRVVRGLYTWTRFHALLYPASERLLRRRYRHFAEGAVAR